MSAGIALEELLSYVLEFNWMPPEQRTVSRRKVAAHMLFHSQRHWAQLAALVRLRLPGRPAVQFGATLGSGGLFCCLWKHERHSTGLPCVGLKGTVVAAPHSEQVVRVSARTRTPPLPRLALHCLQRLGSFLNCLS